MNDLIPELLKSVAGTVARNALGPLMAWLVAKGWIVAGDDEKILVLAGVIVAGVAWGIWQKYAAAKVLSIALSLPEGATLTDVRTVQDIEKNGGRKSSLLLLTIALVLPFSACGKPEQLARGAAQTYVGLNGIADGIVIMARSSEVDNASARQALIGLGKVNLTAEVFSQRLQAGGYSKTAALDAANQVLHDLRALYNQQLFSASEPAKVRWQLLFFAAETGINTAKLVIAKRAESKTEARKAAIAAGDAVRAQIAAHTASRGISPAALMELIALAQRVTVDLVTVNLMTGPEAWAYRADLADALKTKLNQ